MAWSEIPSYDQVVDALSKGMLSSEEAYRYGTKFIVREPREHKYDNAMFIVDPDKKTVELTSLIDLYGFGIIDKCERIHLSDIRL